MSPKLEKFADRIPVMNKINPTRRTKNGAYYEVVMEEFFQKLHRDLPPTRLWGFNRQYPGPTFETKTGESVQVKWMNNLPLRHILPIDHSIFHSELPEVRTVTHLHGGETPSSTSTRGCFKQSS